VAQGGFDVLSVEVPSSDEVKPATGVVHHH